MNEQSPIHSPHDKETEGIFRKTALKRYTSLEQLDEMLQIVSTRKWIALLFLGLFVLAIALWSFFGSISIQVQGRGILIHEKGFFTLSANDHGIIQEFELKRGQAVEAKQKLMQFKDPNNEYEITSPYPGTLLDIFVNSGDSVVPGTPLLWLEHLETQEEPLIVTGFFPLDPGKQIKVGDPVEIEVSTVNVNEYGSLLGSVTEISQFPVAAENLVKFFQNRSLVDYLLRGNDAMLNVRVELQKDPTSTSGYKWTSKHGPPHKLTTGTLCTLQAIVEHVKPIYYLLPLSRFQSETE